MTSSHACRRSWFGTGIGTVLPLAVILAVTGGLIWMAVNRAIQVDLRTRCADHLRLIYDASDNYARVNQGFWPDVYGETSTGWFDVGNTRPDRWDPVAAAPSAGGVASAGAAASHIPPADPGYNGMPVQSNTANLWALTLHGLDPAVFTCPATADVVDRVDLGHMRTAWAGYLAAKTRAETELARQAAAEEAAAEKAAAEKAPSDDAIPRELTLQDLFGPDPKPKESSDPSDPPESAPPEEALEAPEAVKVVMPDPPDIPMDFRGETFCSYSYQNVLGRFALRSECDSPAEAAVLADANPMRRDFWSGPKEKSGKNRGKASATPPAPKSAIRTRIGRGVTDSKLADQPRFIDCQDTRPWQTEAGTLTQPWDLNSPNHRFAGQNVLYLDGHVEWTLHPYCGPRFDNIWLRRRTDVAREPMTEEILNLREFNDTASYDGQTRIGEEGEGSAPDAGDPAVTSPGTQEKPFAPAAAEASGFTDSFLVP